ncbi:MAG: hypothetical protein F8N36_07825 [Desulfovibrio sp.]|uniref:hypothetical protein n=1 Tax=Desulfovibrio sp. TaxID=885 RepID=UPI00135EB56A|nr:hypothetical protein [Desulfovibrio sp.]MTJ92755.1 hypothetical protein [Desulfovibrio sp.]
MKRSITLLQLFVLVLALCHLPVAAAGAGYGFESARAYLEARSRDMTDFQNRFENDLFQNLDDANAINIKYKTIPAEYVLYRLDLAKGIEASSKKPEKLAALCRNFMFIDGAEKDYNAKIQAYNENIAEKFIQREMYQLMDDDALREVLVNYLTTYSMIYGFNKPETLKVKIEKSVPYKTEDGDFGVLYTVHVIEKEAATGAGAKAAAATAAGSAASAADATDTDAEAATYTPDRVFLASYHQGEIVNFEQATDDAADLAVLKLCGKPQ